jgi:Family of unknown function (DUF6009)
MIDEHLHRAMAHELAIVWLQDITDLDYVRQGASLLWTRIRAPGNNTGERRVVGYATVGPAARGVMGYFLRGYFGSRSTIGRVTHVARTAPGRRRKRWIRVRCARRW